MLSRFHVIPEHNGWSDRQTDGRTDRRTDRFAISISRVSMLARDRKLFLWAASASQIVCVNFEPLKNYNASQLTMLKNTQKCNKFGLVGGTPGNYRPVSYIFKAPAELMLSCLTRNPATYHFRDIRVKWQKSVPEKLSCSEKNYDSMLNLFDIPERDRQTNGRTDRQLLFNNVRQCADAQYFF